jgi:aminopeptidase-like protein
MQTIPKKVYYYETSIGFCLTTDQVEAELNEYDLAVIDDLEDYISMIGEKGIFREPVEVESGVYLWNESEMSYRHYKQK